VVLNKYTDNFAFACHEGTCTLDYPAVYSVEVTRVQHWIGEASSTQILTVQSYEFVRSLISECHHHTSYMIQEMPTDYEWETQVYFRRVVSSGI
jgi:hypothetical protein